MMRRQIRRRVGVIMGGSAGEQEASLRSGHAVAEALSSRGHEVVPVVLGDAFGPDLGSILQRSRLDVAFLALSGRLGEDGCVQGLLELMRIPYTGSNVLASALSMDKLKAKEMFRLHNVPTPPYYTVTVDDDLAELSALHGAFGYPVVVKPRGEGQSQGLSRVTSFEELGEALQKAFEYDDVAIVERFVAGMEINVGILDGRVLGAVEVAGDGTTPVRLSPQRERGVLNLAERAARALGCTGAARVDLLVTAGENEYVLEVNTLPTMEPDGLLARSAEAAGRDFASLCEEILEAARLHQPARRKPRVEAKQTFRQASANELLMKQVG
jgi:D-alanine-D-alanine ligase